MDRFYSISILRVFCLIQVFLLHYFMRIGLRNEIWIFQVAVPAFLLVSSFLYGLKRNNRDEFQLDFLAKRFKTIASSYYPFIIVIFTYYAISDFLNIKIYTISLIGELLFLCNIVNPLPHCGHLWFFQSLVSCYIVLFFTTKIKMVESWFTTKTKILTMLIIIFFMGFIYRGAIMIYLFFYLFTFYNAKKIATANYNILVLLVLLILGYVLLFFKYEELFKIGIYLKYIQTCSMAIISILLFFKVFSRTKNIEFVTWLSSISMEFYLIHHIFVFDFPIYFSLSITFLFSIILHYFAQKINSFNSKTINI